VGGEEGGKDVMLICYRLVDLDDEVGRKGIFIRFLRAMILPTILLEGGHE